MRQIDLDFEAGLTKRYDSVVDVARAVAYGCGKHLKQVAADMDLSQSELTRKLAENPNDPRNLTARDLDALVSASGEKGKDIVYWLIEKHLEDPASRRDRAREMLMQMAPLFQALMADALPDLAPDDNETELRLRAAK